MEVILVPVKQGRLVSTKPVAKEPIPPKSMKCL
jgi:hypothetical protein